MTQPTAEAWREARHQSRVHGHGGELGSLSFAAGWTAGIDEGRRQIAEQIALLTIDDPAAREQIVRYLADTLTQED